MAEGRTKTQHPANAVGTASPSRLDIGILLPVCLTLFMGGLWSQAFAPLIPEIAGDLGTTVALVGQVSTVSLIMIGLGSLISGPLADYFGHRRTIAAGLGIGVLAALLFASAPTYLALLLAGLIGGLGFSLVHGVSFGVIVASFHGVTQRRALSISQAVVVSAGIIGAPIVTSIATVLDWRGTFVVIAVVLALAMILVIRLIPGDPPEQTSGFTVRQVMATYPPLIRSHATRNLYLAAIIRAIGFGGPMVFISAFLIEQHGFTLREVGYALMASGAGIFLGNLFAGGGWMNRFDLRWVYTLATASLGFGWLLIFTIQVPALAAVAIMTITFFVAGISYISRLSLLAATSTAGSATTMTLNTAALGLGNAAGTAIAGALLGLGGFAVLGLIMPLFSVAAGLVIWAPGRQQAQPVATR